MDIQSIERLLHPIKIQILKMLATKEELTTHELACNLPDIPQASLYRHLRAMLQDGILEVSQERKVRGTIERSYRLKRNPFDEITARKDQLTKNELLDLFFSFMIAELSNFADYLGTDEYPIERNHISFASNSLYLSDSELKDFASALSAVIKNFSQNEPCPERRLHKFSFSIIPTRSGGKKPSNDAAPAVAP